MTRLKTITASCLRLTLLIALTAVASLSLSSVAFAQKANWVSFANQTQQTLDIYTSDLEFLERVRPGRQSDQIDFNTGERVGAFNPNTNQWVATMAINRTGTVVVSNGAMGYQGAPQQPQGNTGQGGGGGIGQQGGGGIGPQNGGGQGNVAPSNVAAEVLRLINIERAKAGRKPVTRDAGIDAIVAPHNRHLAALPQAPRSNEEAHVGYTTRDQQIRQLATGNIPQGEIVGAATPGAGVAQQLVNGWMNSPGHAKILLSPVSGTGLVGIAIDTGAQWTYGTCFFADRSTNSNTNSNAAITNNTNNGATSELINVTIFNADLNPAKITINGVASIEVPAGPSSSFVQAKIGDAVGFKSATNQGVIRVSATNNELKIPSTTKPLVSINNTSQEVLTILVVKNGVETTLTTLKPNNRYVNRFNFTRGSTLIIRTLGGSASRIVNNNLDLTYGNNGLVQN